MEVYHFSCLLSLKMARHLKMVIRSVRRLNTAAGLHDYSIAVICDPAQMGIVTESLAACGLKHEAAFVHRQSCKELKFGLISITQIHGDYVIYSCYRRRSKFVSLNFLLLCDDAK